MKEVVIISGKGGTGKTSLTAAYSCLGGQDVVVADCDVDAADMHLLLQPDFANPTDFFSGLLAQINPDMCTNCGACVEVCRFAAIQAVDNQHTVMPLDCEGCGYCSRVCPANAITMQARKVGKWYISRTKLDSVLVHACLGIGAENSGKLVAQVKREARRIAREKKMDIVLIDGSPGIGCPVISSLSGADLVVLVTEPTLSGLHDLKRIYRLVKKFNIKSGCIINKSDLNGHMRDEIERFLLSENIAHIASLPYDNAFIIAMINGKTVIEYNSNGLIPLITGSWDNIKRMLNE